MSGDRWQKLANLRALYGYRWAHPGKKLLFMGGELAQEQERSYQRSIDWHLLGRPEHAGVQRLVRDPTIYCARSRPSTSGSSSPPASGGLSQTTRPHSARYGGSNLANPNGIEAEPIPWHGQDASAEITLPPLGVVWLVPSSSDPLK